MTKVRFTFVDVQGNPLPLLEFKILLRRASFNIEDVGVALPEELNVTTDASGQVIVELWPLKAAYRVQVADEYEELCGKLNWSFYVPQTDEIIEAQTLFLVPPPNNIPWDEEAMGKIAQAVQDTQVNKEAAKASADSAAQSSINASQSASQALASKNAAKVSEDASKASQTAAKASETAAAASGEQARLSAVNAGNSAVAAAQSASQASTAGAAAGTAAANAVVANKQDKHVNLTAFSGLAGANGRVPVFTAAGAMTTVDITAPLDPKTFNIPSTSLTRVAEAVHAALSAYGFYTNDGTINIDNLPGGWCGLVSTGLGGVMPPLAGGFFWLSCQQTYSGQSQLQTAVQYGGSATDPNSVSLHPGIAIRIRNQLGTAWGPWGKTLSSRDVVASHLDQTVGKVLTVGYQGLGSDAAPALVDMNQPFGSGFSWSTSGTSNPWVGFASGSNIITSSASTAEVAQIGFSRSTPLRVAARRKTSGNWQALVEFIHTGNMTNDPALNTGGILNTTTVSGVFVSKFLGGTLTMAGTGAATASVAANATVTVDITVPTGFLTINTAVPLVSAVGSVNNDFYAPAAYMVNGVTLRITIRNGATAQTFTPRFYIAGRWSA